MLALSLFHQTPLALLLSPHLFPKVRKVSVHRLEIPPVDSQEPDVGVRFGRGLIRCVAEDGHIAEVVGRSQLAELNARLALLLGSETHFTLGDHVHEFRRFTLPAEGLSIEKARGGRGENRSSPVASIENCHANDRKNGILLLSSFRLCGKILIDALRTENWTPM